MTAFQRRLLWAASVLTGATGAVYWWMEHLMEPLDPWAAINHPLQPWVLKAHILVAPVLVFALGLVAAGHVWKHLRGAVRAGRRSGLLTIALFGPMVLSGYLIQVVTHAGWSTLLVWAHLGTGVAYVAGLGVHQWGVGKRRAPDGPAVPSLAVLALVALLWLLAA